jgi:hypothetical protein
MARRLELRLRMCGEKKTCLGEAQHVIIHVQKTIYGMEYRGILQRQNMEEPEVLTYGKVSR